MIHITKNLDEINTFISEKFFSVLPLNNSLCRTHLFDLSCSSVFNLVNSTDGLIINLTKVQFEQSNMNAFNSLLTNDNDFKFLASPIRVSTELGNWKFLVIWKSPKKKQAFWNTSVDVLSCLNVWWYQRMDITSHTALDANWN